MKLMSTMLRHEAVMREDVYLSKIRIKGAQEHTFSFGNDTDTDNDKRVLL